MRRLHSCAPVADVLSVLAEPATMDERAPRAPQALPPTQQRLVAALHEGRALMLRGGAPLAADESPEALAALLAGARPLAAHVDAATGDVRRVYALSDHELVDLVQFGPARLLREDAVTLSRALVQLGTAHNAGACVVPKRLLGLRADATDPPLFTGVALVYDAPAQTLADALRSRQPDVCAAAARAAFGAIRRLAGARVLGSGFLLEDVHLDLGSHLGSRVAVQRCQRINGPEAVEAAAGLMLLELAGQAARVGGVTATKTFLQDAFEVSNTPTWRSKMLKAFEPGVAVLRRTGITLRADAADAVASAGARGVATLGTLVQERCPGLICNVDTGP
jgi:hypothetical protein